MKVAAHEDGAPYDVMLPKVVGICRSAIMHPQKSDDAVLLFVGPTGTGKSRLTLWVDTIFTPNPDPKQITLSTEGFADSVKRGLSLPKGERYLHFDETNASRREGMSKWNKAMIKLYFKIREEGFLHCWDHPSPNNIDLEFVRERVNGLFLCYEKVVNRPRRYYFFTKEQLLDYLEVYGKLTTRGLLKHASEYALYRGSFNDYSGPLLAEYKKQKKQGMAEAIDEFAGEWGTNQGYYSVNKAARMLKVDKQTVQKAINELVDNGTFTREDIMNVGGHYCLTEQHLDHIKEHKRKQTEKRRMERGLSL